MKEITLSSTQEIGELCVFPSFFPILHEIPAFFFDNSVT